MPLSNDIYALIGFACEATVWGAYSILFISSLRVLYKQRNSGNVTPIILFFNCLLFGCATAHYALEFNHFYTYLIANGVPNYADETKPLFGADILISLTDFIGDMFLLWRCWVVWEGNFYVLILPFLTSLAGFASIMEVLHLLLGINPSAPVPPAALVPLGLAGYILPLCTNAMVTALIAGRIWWKNPGMYSRGGIPGLGNLPGRAISIIIESGVIYLVVQFIFVILFGISHPSEAIVGVVAVQVYGIVPTLIIIRVGLGQTWESTFNKPLLRGSRRGSSTHVDGTSIDSANKRGDEVELAEV